MEKKNFASILIDALGGTSAVAELCEIKPPSVSEWRHNGIPHPWMKFLSLARPDDFKAAEHTANAIHHEAA